MASDWIQALENVFANIKSLASDDDFKAIGNAFEKNQQLSFEIGDRDTEINHLAAQIADLKLVQKQQMHQQIETFCEERNEYKQHLGELDNKIATLETDLQEHVASIEKQRCHEESLQEELDKNNKSLDDKSRSLANASGSISRLKDAIKDKMAHIEDMKLELEQNDIQISHLQHTNEALEKDAQELEKKLQEERIDLREMRSYLGPLRQLDDAGWNHVVGEWMRTWELASQLVHSVFSEDIPEVCLEKTGAWDYLWTTHDVQGIPHPPSNSSEAKKMRIAAVLAILARSIDHHVFKRIHLLGQEEVLRPILRNQAVSDSRKESFHRAVLLGFAPEEQASNAAASARKLIVDFSERTRNLLPSVQHDLLTTGLEAVVEQAHRSWVSLQMAKDKFEPLFDIEELGMQWQPMEFDDENDAAFDEDGTAVDIDGDKPLVAIFPRIYVIKDADPEPVTPGVALMESQIVEARTELARLRAARLPNSSPRGSMYRGRTMSMSSNGGFFLRRSQAATE